MSLKHVFNKQKGTEYGQKWSLFTANSINYATHGWSLPKYMGTWRLVMSSNAAKNFAVVGCRPVKTSTGPMAVRSKNRRCPTTRIWGKKMVPLIGYGIPQPYQLPVILYYWNFVGRVNRRIRIVRQLLCGIGSVPLLRKNKNKRNVCSSGKQSCTLVWFVIRPTYLQSIMKVISVGTQVCFSVFPFPHKGINKNNNTTAVNTFLPYQPTDL